MLSCPRMAPSRSGPCRAALSRSTFPCRPASVTEPGNCAGVESTGGPTGNAAGEVMTSSSRPRLAVVAEEFVELGVGCDPIKAVELAVIGDGARRLDEGIHR